MSKQIAYQKEIETCLFISINTLTIHERRVHPGADLGFPFRGTRGDLAPTSAMGDFSKNVKTKELCPAGEGVPPASANAKV